MIQPTNQLADEEIVRQVKSGETELFGVLVKRYEAKISRYARKFLSNYHDIEDMVQEIFIKTYANIQSFDTSRKFSPWLYRIAHNEFINAIRKKGKEPLPFFDLDILFPHIVSKEHADKEIKEEEMRRMIDSCLDQISPRYREPLILYYLEDLSYKEIADVLQAPVSTVGIRLKRAKEIVKNLCQRLKYEL